MKPSWPHRLWPRRFLVQVTLLTSLMIALGVITLTAYTTTELLEQQYRGTEQRLGAIANNLALGSAHALLVRDHAAVEQLLLRAADYPGVRALAITDATHRILAEIAHRPGQPAEVTFNYGEIMPPRDSGTQFVWRYGKRERGARFAMGLDATALVIWHPIEDGKLGWLRIETAVDDIRANARHLIRDSALIALAVIVFSVFIVFRLLRPSLRAMANATAFAGELTQTYGEQIAVFSGTAELEQLGRALNQTSSRMAAQEQAREAAERELRENEERFRYMLETCPTAARIARSGHDVIFYNSRYAELINARPGEAGGVDPAAYYAQREDYADILQRLGKGEQVFDRLIELNIPGAGTKWAIGSYLPIQYAGQTAVLGWFHDITAQKQAQEAFRASREDLQRLLDAMAEGAYGVDMRGNCTFVNPAFLRLLGFHSADAVLGKHVHELIHHSHADGSPYPAADCKMHRAYRAHQPVHVSDEVFWRADGAAIPVEYWFSPILVDGAVSGAICTFTDITERKRVERMKSEFVSTVSHELRTPLTSISGALGLISGGALGEVPAQARQMLDIAYKNSQRLTFLINDLLDMEKLVAGKMHFDLNPQPLMPVIEQALEANRTYGAERRVTLALTASADVQVRIDSQRLMQVLSNLLSNAIKYSRPGGTVEIAVTEHDAGVRVSIVDHGAGIPAAFRARIFQKFSQADSSDTRQKGGTGLGLAITRELVERMGGQIGFESEEGAGTHFHFDLPCWRGGGSRAREG